MAQITGGDGSAFPHPKGCALSEPPSAPSGRPTNGVPGARESPRRRPIAQGPWAALRGITSAYVLKGGAE
jgi:hypothetical protein